jgi:hypothetical protein
LDHVPVQAELARSALALAKYGFLFSVPVAFAPPEITQNREEEPVL